MLNMGNSEGFFKTLVADVLSDELKSPSSPKFVEVFRDAFEIGKKIWAIKSPDFPFFSI